MAKIRWSDFKPGNHEVKNYFVERKTLLPHGASEVEFGCPWCKLNIVARCWSLAGCGKRCDCGAMFGTRGVGYKLLEDL